jgi:mevalonate kinase
MEKGNRIFSSKILLFGEYLLLCGSKALSIPYSKYSGYLTITDDKSFEESNQNLKKFLKYLQTIASEVSLDLARLKKDITDGLIFRSNIPHGYGLGSSGSLSAAVYDHYAIDKINYKTTDTNEILELKNIFGRMESFFHGKSSGLDPLISYLAEPVLVESKGSLRKVSLPGFSTESEHSAVFLMDYGRSGDTGPLVNGFIERCGNNNFKDHIHREVIPLNNECIDLFLKGDLMSTSDCVKKLSEYTYRFFREMIPKELLNLWKKGFESDDYYLKLCGSGGGGMILGFTKDLAKAREILHEYKLEKVF